MATSPILDSTNTCWVCGALGTKRDNDNILCDTCALLAEMEPEGQFFFNTEAEQ